MCTQFTYVYPCLLVFTYVYSCLPMFTITTRLSLPMFTIFTHACSYGYPVFSCLPMISHVYVC